MADVIAHGKINIYFFFVPFEAHFASEFALTVESDVVMVFDGTDEAMGVVFGEVFE